MKFAPGRRRSIRYSIFIGVLAGSVFSGSGAFAENITSVAELIAMTGDSNYLLTDNLNLSTDDVDSAAEGIQLADESTGFTYIYGMFTGTFDGGGFTISGLTKPLFDYIVVSKLDLDTTISDLTLVAAAGGVSGNGILANGSGALIDRVQVEGNVTGGSGVGGLVGDNSGTITNSSAKSTVTGSQDVGGLVGYNIGEISNSHATGDVYGKEFVGGLAGYNSGAIISSHATGEVDGESNVGGLVGSSEIRGYISDSHATGNVTGSGEYIGGLVGWLAFGASISNSYANTGTVTGTGEDEDYHGIGGLVGYSSGFISDSHAEGNVDGFYQVGGLVGSTGVASYITNSYATGEVTGRREIGGLVGRLDYSHEITNSYATGDVTGDDDIGGLVGNLQYGASITNSYATGDVVGTVEFEGGDIGGLVGYSQGLVRNSHSTGDVSGVYDVGGLVGDLQASGVIRNSYATGNVSANGSDGGWRNGWGGLVGEFSGLIENSFATGNVVADYNAGALVGYSYPQDEEVIPRIINSFATGEVSEANNDVVFDDLIAPDEWQQGLGGFVGCKESYDIETGYACDLSAQNFPQLNQETILSVVNTVDDGYEYAFEIVACKNNGLPSLSELINSYENTCVTPSGSNRERRIRDFIQTTPITEIAKTLGFVISPKFPNDASIGFIKSEKELAISKILGVQKAADRVARTSIKTGEALQISYNFDSKDPIELWVKLPDGKWILCGLINFDKNGKAVLPPKQFKVAGEYVLVLNKPSEDSVKANAPLNQIGSLTVFVN